MVHLMRRQRGIQVLRRGGATEARVLGATFAGLSPLAVEQPASAYDSVVAMLQSWLVGGISLVLIYGAALVAAVANPLTKRRLEVRDQVERKLKAPLHTALFREASVGTCRKSGGKSEPSGWFEQPQHRTESHGGLLKWSLQEGKFDRRTIEEVQSWLKRKCPRAVQFEEGSYSPERKAMNFPVPWRALLPADAVPTFSGQDGLREICDATGAGCELSGEGDTPSSLSDKILTISGNVEQKEAACRRIVDKLRVLQEVIDQEPGVFVIIVPSTAAPAVIGSKGAQIKEVIELSGAEVSVAKESIIGMNDQPIGVTGTGGQVVSAVSKINAILQDLADRGRLQPTDFRYRPGAQRPEDSGGSSFGAPGRAAQPTGGNPRTNAKFVVATQVAGWIIGKQGRHIRELQENSGAHIQVLKEGEVPPGVPVTDRIVEIGGRFESKAEGIQIILIAVDNMPALSAPRETLMLIPQQLTTDSEIKDVRQMSGCEIEVRDLPSHDEGLCTLLGNIESRVKAAQQFLKRLEEVMADGSVSLPAPSYGVRPSPSETLPESSASDVWAKPAPSAKDDPWAREDPWSKARDGGVAAKELSSSFAPSADSKASESRSVTFDNNLKVTDIHASYAAPSAQGREPDSQDPAKRGMEMSFGPNGSGGSSFAPNGPAKTTGLSFSPATSGPQMSFAPTGTSGVTQMSFGPSGGPTAGGSAMSLAPNSGAPGLSSGGVRMSFTPNGASSAPPSVMSSSAGMKMSFSPDEPGPGAKMSFSPDGPGAPGAKMSFSPDAPAAGGPSAPSNGAGAKMSFSPDGPGAPGHGLVLRCATNLLFLLEVGSWVRHVTCKTLTEPLPRVHPKVPK
eukprot:s5139_g5.t1